CCERQLDAEELFAEIMSGYPKGKSFAEKESEEMLQRYRLKAHLDKLLTTPASSNDERRQRIKENHAALALETMMAAHVKNDYLAVRNERFRADEANARSVIVEKEALAVLQQEQEESAARLRAIEIEANSRIDKLETAHAAVLAST